MTGHHMHMEMKNRLITLFAIALQKRHSWRIECQLDCQRNLSGSLHRRCSLIRRDIKQRGRMSLECDEDVTRIDLAKIHESHGLFVLVHL